MSDALQLVEQIRSNLRPLEAKTSGRAYLKAVEDGGMQPDSLRVFAGQQHRILSSGWRRGDSPGPRRMKRWRSGSPSACAKKRLEFGRRNINIPFVRWVGVESSRLTDDLLEDALAGYLAEAAEVRGLLDGRYDDIKSGRVTPIEGETFFESSRQSEHGWFRRNPK